MLHIHPTAGTPSLCLSPFPVVLTRLIAGPVQTTLYFSRLEEMAAFQRIILFLIASYAVLSVAASPLVADPVGQQPDRPHLLSLSVPTGTC